MFSRDRGLKSVAETEGFELRRRSISRTTSVVRYVIRRLSRFRRVDSVCPTDIRSSQNVLTRSNRMPRKLARDALRQSARPSAAPQACATLRGGRAIHLTFMALTVGFERTELRSQSPHAVADPLAITEPVPDPSRVFTRRREEATGRRVVTAGCRGSPTQRRRS